MEAILGPITRTKRRTNPQNGPPQIHARKRKHHLSGSTCPRPPQLCHYIDGTQQGHAHALQQAALTCMCLVNVACDDEDSITPRGGEDQTAHSKTLLEVVYSKYREASGARHIYATRGRAAHVYQPVSSRSFGSRKLATAFCPMRFLWPLQPMSPSPFTTLPSHG